jgi:hypothetical protein
MLDEVEQELPRDEFQMHATHLVQKLPERTAHSPQFWHPLAQAKQK